MRMREVRRLAHGAVASFIRANIFAESDLMLAVEDMDDEDADRFHRALEEIADKHEEQAEVRRVGT
jgi:hypothetical protein